MTQGDLHKLQTGTLPCQAVWKFRRDNERILAFQRLLAGSRAKVAYGTDCGMFPFSHGILEFQAMVKAGLSSARALKAATSVAAELLGRSDLGALAPGKTRRHRRHARRSHHRYRRHRQGGFRDEGCLPPQNSPERFWSRCGNGSLLTWNRGECGLGDISRHPGSMIARTRLGWSGEVRQMSAIGTEERCRRSVSRSAVEGRPAVLSLRPVFSGWTQGRPRSFIGSH